MTQGIVSSGWVREIGVPGDSGTGVRGNSVNPYFRFNRGIRISAWLREPGFPSDSRKSEYRQTPRKRSSCYLRESGVPCDSGNTELGWNRETTVPIDSGTPDSSVSLQDTGVFRCFGMPECSGWLPETGVPFEPRNPDFRVTHGIPSSGWVRELGVPGVFWDIIFWWLWEPRGQGDMEFGVPGYSVNSEFRVTHRTHSSMWLRELGDTGDSGNPELRLSPTIHSSG